MNGTALCNPGALQSFQISSKQKVRNDPIQSLRIMPKRSSNTISTKRTVSQATNDIWPHLSPGLFYKKNRCRYEVIGTGTPYAVPAHTATKSSAHRCLNYQLK